MSYRRNFKNTYSDLSGEEIYKRWHWGKPFENKEEIDDPNLPDRLIETGRLAELHFWPVKGRTARKDKVIKLPEKLSEESHLAFDPDHNFHRLYIILPTKLKKKFKKEYWDNTDLTIFDPSDIANAAGGKHATDDYPDIEVKPIGILRNIVYACEKVGDGFSLYIHKMGEESGIKPALCVDKSGDLWIVGGDYTSPLQGITN
jgi:hypothetical protein